MATRTQPALPLPAVDVPREPIYQVWPPRVESREALDLLVAEIIRVDALVDHARADLKQEVARITNNAAADLAITFDGNEMPLADWRAKLVAAAEKFCDRNREKLLEDGRKSFDTNHGRAGWQDSKPALEPLPDFDEDGNDKILKGLLKELRLHLQKTAEFADGGARYVEVKLSWRKKELLKAHSDEELSLAILRKTGFTVREETEEFYVKALPGELASQSAEKPK